MNVYHISTSDFSGGAAIAAFRLNEAMNCFGINSKMLVLEKKSSKDDVEQITGFTAKLYTKILTALIFSLNKKILQPKYLFSTGFLGLPFNKFQELKKADAIYIHWINSNFISIKEIALLASWNKPIFIFMHDMWTITGGCHHSFECEKYKTGCRNCPIIQNTLFKKLSNRVFKQKLKYLSSKKNINIIAPSKWLTKCAQESMIFKNHPVFNIPNLIDIHQFKPIDRKIAREILNLPSCRKLLLFGAANSTNDLYKGWKHLLECLKGLKDKDIELVIFGNKNETPINDIPFKIHWMGVINDNPTKSLLYSACDIFLSPSLAENFSLTIEEALSCATPVVAFDIGGNSDLITHKFNGYIAMWNDISDFRKGIEWILYDSNMEDLISNARASVVSRYSYEEVIKNHLNILSL